MILSVALSGGWLTAARQSAARQAAAIRAVGLDPEDEMMEAAVPPWLRGLLGQDFFIEVRALDVMDDQGLERLNDLPDLERLRFGHHCDRSVREIPNTTLDLEHLTDLHQVKSLYFEDVSISDAGMARLARMGHLRGLDFQETCFSRDGFACIARLAGLEELSLSMVLITKRSPETLDWLGMSSGKWGGVTFGERGERVSLLKLSVLAMQPSLSAENRPSDFCREVLSTGGLLWCLVKFIRNLLSKAR
jgi:hypothetical protein